MGRSYGRQLREADRSFAGRPLIGRLLKPLPDRELERAREAGLTNGREETTSGIQQLAKLRLLDVKLTRAPGDSTPYSQYPQHEANKAASPLTAIERSEGIRLATWITEPAI